jgi:hypothetical protein
MQPSDMVSQGAAQHMLIKPAYAPNSANASQWAREIVASVDMLLMESSRKLESAYSQRMGSIHSSENNFQALDDGLISSMRVFEVPDGEFIEDGKFGTARLDAPAAIKKGTDVFSSAVSELCHTLFSFAKGLEQEDIELFGHKIVEAVNSVTGSYLEFADSLHNRITNAQTGSEIAEAISQFNPSVWSGEESMVSRLDILKIRLEGEMLISLKR